METAESGKIGRRRLGGWAARRSRRRICSVVPASAVISPIFRQNEPESCAMTHQVFSRCLLLAVLVATPLVAGCDQDTHSTATGLPKSTGLTPNEGGKDGSGSIATEKVNAGGPGAPGTTPANPGRN